MTEESLDEITIITEPTRERLSHRQLVDYPSIFS